MEQKATTAKERVEIEKAELSDRLEKLNVYIANNPHFKTLSDSMQALLIEQASHMSAYRDCLQSRLEIWE